MVAVLCCAPAVAAGFSQMAVKRLFAPPDEVLSGRIALPAPERTPTVSRVLALSAAFGPSTGDPRIVVAAFSFDHAGGVIRLLPLGVGASEWRASIETAESGGVSLELNGWDERAPLRVAESIGTQSAFGLDEATRAYEMDVTAGRCIVRLFAPAEHRGRSAALVVEDASPDVAVAHLRDRVQRVGEPVELVVGGVTPFGPATSELLGRGAGQRRTVVVDDMTVRWSDGRVEGGRVLGEDGRGRWIVRTGPAVAGDAHVCVQMRVHGLDGRWRPRTILYSTRVAAGPSLDRGRGTARISADPTVPGWLHVDLPVSLSVVTDANEVVFAAAELWAHGGGRARCLGWIGGLASVEQADDHPFGATAAFVRLGCAAAHLQLGPDEGIGLRAVRLHARDGWVPLDLLGSMAVDVGDALLGIADARRASASAHDWRGIPGIATVPAPTGLGEQSGFLPAAGAHALVLTHGYCADANTWPMSQFGGDAWQYVNANQNMSNDVFAVDIALRGREFKSYGVVGHSQGGAAALHLHAFYWSGLDWAGAGRLIQAVGTPFEGTALAGNLAALGEIFGVQCGTNFDMTYDGAAAWLSTIPTAPRSRVYSYTTTFTNNPFVYDYCNIVSDFFLTDPEDGVVEDWSGHFVGGNNMGLKTGWCHVSGMRDPDQTLDGARNAVMNAQGAR